ncbi:hypothetical protein XA67_02940 [Comamonas thiooxydans]|uniref:DUF1800 domain-containing protein n=1 Tax=Comamonas thiooxydans TaxID=363952 RepID=UPI0006223607|nr:DUF1800 domain-containing protein [Comamonas thiooxydans]KKI15741.1 hypothetical protein XA67_02940 [Comamonas thiooxydans]
MRLLPFSPVQGLLCLAALALTACAPLGPSSSRPSLEVLQTLSSSALPDKPSVLQSQQWLDRVTWGATDHDAARLQQQGLKRWLAAQLSPSSAPMPPEVQQHIDALGISQKPMAQIQREIADQRLAIRNSQDPEEAAKLRSELQRQLNQLGGEAQKRHIWRALYSPHQLQEQMTWFWMNHFNVSTRKGDVRMWVGDYEEQAIRPHALGKFRELLTASMRHPAMLLYLDNASNAAGRINENYARELLELHTMGVGSGYTQADVQAMAHVLTGVGFSTREVDAPPPKLRPERQGDYVRHGFFEFNPNRHDYTPQVLLGRPLEKSGLPQVNEAVDRIVASPVTARFIARKLCVYFLGDKPPQAVVERTAQAFERSHGDIAATLATLLSDPQAQQFGQRFKDPVHYVLGATRLAYDQRVASDVGPVQNWLNQLGQPLYGHETPDGYPVTQSDWSSSDQMNARFEVARQIGSRGALLFRSSPQQPLEKPPYPDLDKRSSVQARVPALGAATRAALAQARNPADRNSFFLSAPEMMYR